MDLKKSFKDRFFDMKGCDYVDYLKDSSKYTVMVKWTDNDGDSYWKESDNGVIND